MNVMAGHVIVVEIHSNLHSCPLIVFNLREGTVGATGCRVSSAAQHHDDILALLSPVMPML